MMGAAEREEHSQARAHYVALRSVCFRTIARGILLFVASPLGWGDDRLEATLLVVTITIVLLLGVAYLVRA
jgi:hypothetical protein